MSNNSVYTPTGSSLVGAINNSATPIDRLDYFGHGTNQMAATYQGEGSQSLYTDNYADRFAGDLGPGAARISDIDASKFARGAEIHLHGCNMGTGNNSFAQQLANHTGLTVYAPSATGGPQTGGMLYPATGPTPGRNTEIKTFNPYWMR